MGNVTIQKKKKNFYVKIKVIAIIINFDETNPFEMDKCKSEKWATVSDALALFKCSSGGYIPFTIPSKQGLSIFKRSSKSICSVECLHYFSLFIIGKRSHETSFIAKSNQVSYKRSATVPIGIPIICLYNLVRSK